MQRHIHCLILLLLITGCTAQPTIQEDLSMTRVNFDQSIDMRGKTISPFIVYHATGRLEKMPENAILEITTDRFIAIENDMKAWCRMSGHRLIELETDETCQRYYIQKQAPQPKDKKLAMIISEPHLETLISPLGLALAAAMSGMEVYLYFQGPAVKVLTKNYQASLKGIAKPFSGFARKGMAKAGHLPPEEKLRQLKDLGVHFYVCGGSLDPFGVAEDDLMFEDIVIAEYFTFLEIMKASDMQIFLQ
jgi:predicted peroxiredoxin/TusA-related sulfurtransferase